MLRGVTSRSETKRCQRLLEDTLSKGTELGSMPQDWISWREWPIPCKAQQDSLVYIRKAQAKKVLECVLV